jgi:hypothetical protein
MNDLQDRMERLLDEPWLDHDRSAVEVAAVAVQRRHRRAVAAGVVALALVVGTGAVLAARPGDRGPTALDVAGEPVVYERADTDRMVFVSHSASAAEQQEVRRRLLDDPAVGQAWWRSQQDAYGEFRCLFADEPDLLNSVTPEILPTEYDVALVDGADAAAFDTRIEAIPAVMEVVSEQSPEAIAASGTSVPWRPVAPDPCGLPERAGVPLR